jgi:predicted RNA-binding Zn ribbon-like protein
MGAALLITFIIVVCAVRGIIEGLMISRVSKNAWRKHDLAQYLRHPDQFKK